MSLTALVKSHAGVRMGTTETPIYCRWECKLVQLLQKTIFQYSVKLNRCRPWTQEILKNTQVCSLKNVYNFILNVYKKVYSSTIIHNSRNWKLSKCLSTLEWVRKLKYIYVIEYHTTIRPHKLQLHMPTQMKLRSIMLGKSSTYYMIPFT